MFALPSAEVLSETNTPQKQQQSEEPEEKHATEYSHQRLEPSNVDFPLQNSQNTLALIPFFLDYLSENALPYEIDLAVTDVIARMMPENSEVKESWILLALDRLQTLATIKMQSTMLCAIEQVMRSNYISNVKTLGLFLKKNKPDNLNHCWSLEDGARLVISSYHPEIVSYTHYIRCPGTAAEMKAITSSLHFQDSVWIVAGYKASPHLTLIHLRLYPTYKNLLAQVFDSVGVVPSNNESDSDFPFPLGQLFINIVGNIKVESCVVLASPRKWQADNENCFSFVLSALDTALKFLGKEFYSTDRDISKLLRSIAKINQIRQAHETHPQCSDSEFSKIITSLLEEQVQLSKATGISQLSENIEVRENKLAPAFFKNIVQSAAPGSVLTKPRSSNEKLKLENPEALLTSARALRALIKNRTITFTSKMDQQKPTDPEPGIDNEKTEPKGLHINLGLGCALM